MTEQDMKDFMEQKIFPALLEVRGKAHAEYAHVDNAFANFERVGGELQLDRRKVLLVYLTKHMDGIKAHVNGHVSQREPVQGRIKDAIMYLCLLWGMED